MARGQRDPELERQWGERIACKCCESVVANHQGRVFPLVQARSPVSGLAAVRSVANRFEN